MIKHPPAQPSHLSAIVPPSHTSDFHPILFDCVTPELIRSSALKIECSSGPSGLDAANWKRTCTSFGTSSSDLCAALASFGSRLCTSFVDPDGLYLFLASRLIALDKQPGVRPIGVGESVRRILCKAVIQVICPDVMEVAGPLSSVLVKMGGVRQLFMLFGGCLNHQTVRLSFELMQVMHLILSIVILLLEMFSTNFLPWSQLLLTAIVWMYLCLLMAN